MKKIDISDSIDFSDAEFKSLNIPNDLTLIVNLISWEEKIIKITFSNVQYCLYSPGDIVQGIYEIVESSSLIINILSKKRCKLDEGNYKYFQLLDIYQYPILEIIADKADLEEAEEVNYGG